jgi:CRP/FNR family cyclic AMP-dependent transcriptional regulator
MERESEVIAGLPLLARLREEDLSALARMGRVQQYAAGTAIFKEGEEGDALYVVLDGRVRISVLSAKGDEVILAVLGPGESFGDLALLDSRPRSATATAATATSAMRVARADFLDWLSVRPTAAAALLETLSLRFRQVDEALSDIAFLDLPRRLAKRLLQLAAAGRSGPVTRSPGPVGIEVTQSELASMLGVTRESINKELRRFSRRGWLAVGRGSVRLADEAALREFAFGP